MPIFEYRCGRCGERVAVLVRSGADTPRCPHCGAPLQERLFSAFHVHKAAAASSAGATCCGREERCPSPPCSSGETCWRE